MERLEKEIAKMEKDQKENKQNFDKAFHQGNRLKMDTLGIEYQDLQNSIEQKLSSWEDLGKEIETIEKSFKK